MTFGHSQDICTPNHSFHWPHLYQYRSSEAKTRLQMDNPNMPCAATALHSSPLTAGNAWWTLLWRGTTYVLLSFAFPVTCSCPLPYIWHPLRLPPLTHNPSIWWWHLFLPFLTSLGSSFSLSLSSSRHQSMRQLSCRCLFHSKVCGLSANRRRVPFLLHPCTYCCSSVGMARTTRLKWSRWN